MSVLDIHATSELSVTRELRALMQGGVVLRGVDDYVRTRKIWNGAAETQPALIALCETTEDVQAARTSLDVARAPRTGEGQGLDLRCYVFACLLN